MGEEEVLEPVRKAIPEGWFKSLGFPFLDTKVLPHGLKRRLSDHIIYAGLSPQSAELLLASHGLRAHRELAISRSASMSNSEKGDADDTSEEGLARFREAVRGAILEGSGQCVVVNYHRGTVHQIPVNNGHFSPVGGYHRESDRCLVLDTNSWRYPPVWIETGLLWRAMCKRTNV